MNQILHTYLRLIPPGKCVSILIGFIGGKRPFLFIGAVFKSSSKSKLPRMLAKLSSLPVLLPLFGKQAVPILKTLNNEGRLICVPAVGPPKDNFELNKMC